MEIKAVAHIENDFTGSFGIPRQAGLVPEIISRIVFNDGFRNPDYIRGLEMFSHIWLIWDFSENHEAKRAATVRPPRLGGNRRVGVFASRSPYRPNPLALSCVKIESIDFESCAITVSGADMMNGSPIFDIKPYLPYSDILPEAKSGYAPMPEARLKVIIEKKQAGLFPAEKLGALVKILELDPRPAYRQDQKRQYGLEFAGFEIKFFVDGNILTVKEISKCSSNE